jgi:hypothetical protein
MRNGRDLPRTPRKSVVAFPGATHGAYRVERWPTTVLIDREGGVAHVFRDHPLDEVMEGLSEGDRPVRGPDDRTRNPGATLVPA